MAKIKYIDPIEVMMSDILSRTQIEVKVGYQTEYIFHIEIDPDEILRRLPKFLSALGQAQYDGHHIVSGERPDKVIIHFDGHSYEAEAKYEEIKHNEFKGYKHG